MKKLYIKLKNTTVLFYLVVILWYVFSYIVVLKSGYCYDDRINVLSRGGCYNNSMTLFDLTKKFCMHWIKENGRLYIFSWYGYFFFAYVPLFAYKCLIVLSVFLNGVVFSKIIGEMSSNKELEKIILMLFPVFMPLYCSYFNPLYGFHMLVQFCFMMVCLSAYYYLRYLKTNRNGFNVISCICWFVALGTYEVSYALCFVFPIIFLSVYSGRLIKKNWKKIIPHVMIGLGWFALYVYFAMNKTSSGYAGVQVSFNLLSNVTALLKQLSGSLSLGFITSFWRNISHAEGHKILSEESWRYLGILLSGCAGYFIIAKEMKRKKTESRKLYHIGLLVGLNLVFMIMPAILVSVSARYQNEIRWGYGYLPAYVSCWGITGIIGLLIYMVMVRLKSHIKQRAVSLMLFLFLGANILLNQAAGYFEMKNSYDAFQKPMNFFLRAVDDNLFEKIDNTLPLVNLTPYVGGFDSDFYATFLKKPMHVLTSSDLMENDVETETDAYYIVNHVSDVFIWMAQCEDRDIITSSEGNLITTKPIKLEVYIEDPKYTSIECTDETGQIITVPLKSENIVGTGRHGIIYEIDIPAHANITSLNIRT